MHRKEKNQTICSNCVMDTTDSKIQFDSNGVCDHCNGFMNDILTNWNPDKEDLIGLEKIAIKIREDGRGKKYDCIIGMSGGMDSSYLAFIAKEKMGLRPLLYSVDTGWNLPVADQNIKNIVDGLNLDLKVEVVDWVEMKDLQNAFLKSQVPYQDLPQDHAIFAALYNYAVKSKIKYVLTGSNIATEAVRPPIEWVYMNDLKLIKSIHRKFGKVKLKKFPTCGMFKYRIFYPYFRGLKRVAPLDYVRYKKSDVENFLHERFDWNPYENKHYENLFTRFYEGYYLPVKFGFDKRKSYLSNLILSGQMNRKDALIELSKQAYDGHAMEEDMVKISNKLSMSKDELVKLINEPNKDYSNYPNGLFSIKLAVFIAKIFGGERRTIR